MADIARWAHELVRWRDDWLNPPAPEKGTIDVAYDKLLKARTLTNLYNGLVYYRRESRPRLRPPPLTRSRANRSPALTFRNWTTSTAPWMRPFSAPTGGWMQTAGPKR
ncbi:MAG: hypothetical protein R3C44_24505 [Chloroflexota bacterium]